MEYITTENILLIGSTLLIAGVLIGKSSYRFGLPLLLIFLLVGMAFGTDGVGIQFSNMHTAQFIGMIALCIILFSGGMGTKIAAIRPVVLPGLVLSTVGVLLTALLTGVFIWWLSGMSWTNIHFALLPSLLLASTMSSTDSASVFGILGSQKVGLRNNLRPMLELESGSNDPMAYMLTIILIETITVGGSLSAGALVVELLLQFGVGIAGGFVMGKITLWLIGIYRRIDARSANREDAGQAASMISILMIGAVFFTFAGTTALAGNGYLAVYICGIVIGNAPLPNHRGIAKILDGMTWFAQIVVFLMLGLLVNPHEMISVAPVSLLIGVFMILVGRPLSVFLSLAPMRKVSLKSKAFISWVGLRGAVPIIFATYPVVAGIEGAGQYSILHYNPFSSHSGNYRHIGSPSARPCGFRQSWRRRFRRGTRRRASHFSPDPHPHPRTSGQGLHSERDAAPGRLARDNDTPRQPLYRAQRPPTAPPRRYPSHNKGGRERSVNFC